MSSDSADAGTAYAVGSGFAADRMEAAVAGIRDRLPVLSPEDEALMREAGSGDVSLFYAGLTFRGWVAYA